MNVSTLQNSEDNQTQLLQNIASLQDMEKDLYKQLEAAPLAASTSTQQCAASFGENTASDGTSYNGDPKYQCPSTASTCSGYVKNQKWGSCSSPDPSVEQEKIIQKINELSEMRIALFKNLTF